MRIYERFYVGRYTTRRAVTAYAYIIQFGHGDHLRHENYKKNNCDDTDQYYNNVKTIECIITTLSNNKAITLTLRNLLIQK